MTITDVEHGEALFRDGERRVIARLLASGPQVLATGGGAAANAETRANIKRHGVSVAARRVAGAHAAGAEARHAPAPAERRPGGGDAG